MKTYDERMDAVRQKLHKKQIQRRAMMATAGALCLCIVAGIIFWPFGSDAPITEKYMDSEYYPVICAIERDFPQNKDNAWWLDDGIFLEGTDISTDTDMDRIETISPPGSAENGSADSNANSSVEITDHQVAGVHEADIIKRSQTHIFYLDGRTLKVYPIAGEETQELCKWSVPSDQLNRTYDWQMYLSEDATRLTIVMFGYGNVLSEVRQDSFTKIISLDVSDPANIQQAGEFCITGSMISSRMVGQQLMLVSQFRMANKIDFEDETTFLPQIGTPGNMHSIPADNIVIPEKLENRCYTVVTLLDSRDVSLTDCGAFMSYSTEIYVSQEHIYATRSQWISEDHTDEEYTVRVHKSVTDISCMAYGEDGLTYKSTFRVDGTINNQYNMDEHEGVLRIVTETTEQVGYVSSVGNGGEIATLPSRSQNANLTCFEVGTWNILAEVKAFAPEGETVESVRFDGDYAYVCTAVVITLSDPVFFFDMTDLGNIIVKDTGTIDGYSSSLIQLKDGFLMGIGYNDSLNLKVEIYEETENGVASVCEYVKVDRFATDYKAYYIDRENNLFGIPTGNGYILLQFDGYQLHLLAYAETEDMYHIIDLNFFRGVVIDEYLYVCGPNYFKALNIR